MNIEALTLQAEVQKTLTDIQYNYFKEALKVQESKLRINIETWEDFQQFLKDKRGAIMAPWSKDPESEQMLTNLKSTVRCIPLDQEKYGNLSNKKCVLTGQDAKCWALFGPSY